MRSTATGECSTRRASPTWQSARRGRRSGCPCRRGPSIFRPLMPSHDNVMEKLVSLAKRRGFVFQSSEIYGGLGSVWDYGPLGVELKKNIKERWWRSLVHEREDIEGLDAAILMHPKVWEARSEEHTSELQSLAYLVCRLLLEKKNRNPFRQQVQLNLCTA